MSAEREDDARLEDDAPADEALADDAAEEAEESEEAEEAEEAEAAPRRRRWGVWLRRLALVLVLGAIALRLALVVALPYAAHAGAAVVGLDVRLDDHRLSLLWGELELRGVNARLAASGEELADLRRVLVDVSISDLLTGSLVVERVELEGLRGSLERDADGELTLLTAIEEALGPSEPEPEEPEPESGDGELPAIAVAQVTLRDVRVEWIDRAVSPEVRCQARLDEATVLDWELAAPFVPRLTTVELGIPDVLGALRVEVRRDTGSAPWLSAEVSVEGAELAAAGPYLTPLGLEPSGDALDLFVAARAPWVPPYPTRYELNRVELTAGGQRALLLAGLLGDVEFEPELRVRNLELERLQADAVRREDGALLAGGLVFAPPAEAPDAAGPGPEEPEGDQGEPEAGAAADDATPLRLLLERLRLDQVGVRLDDQTQEPAQTLAVTLEHAQVEDLELDLAPDARPRTARYDLLLTAPGVADSVAAVGTLVPSPVRPALGLELSLEGLRQEQLRPYLAGSGVAPIYTAAHARLSLDASVAPSTSVDQALDLALCARALELQDGERRWLGFERLELRAHDVATSGSSLVVERVLLRGFEAEAEQRPDGAVWAAGWAFAPTPTPPADEASAEADPWAGATAGAPTPAGPLVERLPRVVLDELELGGGRLSWITPAGRRELEGWRLHAPGGWVLPDDPRAAPPLELAFELRARQLLEELDLRASLSPFAPQPRASLELSIHGLDGPELAQLAGPGVQATTLTRGEAGARLEVTGREPFTGEALPVLDLTLSEVALEGAPRGPNLFVLDRLQVRGVELEPGAVRVERVEVEAPQLEAKRSETHVEVCGLEFALPKPEAEPATVSAPPAPLAPTPLAPAPPPAPATSVTLQALDVRDLVLTFVDTSFDPPVFAPLESGELHLRDLRWPPRPGDPRLTATLSLESAGLADGAGPAFEQLDVSSTFDLFTRTGSVTVDLEALALANLRGAARSGGVDLGGGRASALVELNLGADSLGLDTDLSFRDLSLSEPSGGPLSSYLNLPLGLDSVVFLLRDERGEIEVPFDLYLPRQGLTLPRVLTSVLKTLGVVIGRAALRSPLRGLNQLKDLGTGFLGMVLPGEVRAAESLELRCVPGGVALSTEGEDRLNRLIARARDRTLPPLVLIHHAGQADAEAVARVQTPSHEDLRLAVSRVEARLRELDRGARALRARVQTLGREEAPPDELSAARAELRGLESARLRLLESLDELSVLFAENGRAQNPRTAARKLRRGVVRLGAARLEALTQRLMRVPGLRVRVTRPVHDAEAPPGPGWIEVAIPGTE